MKTALILFITIFSLGSAANENLTCEQQGNYFGDPKYALIIEKKCKVYVKKNASVKSIFLGENFNLFGYNNLILIEKMNENKEVISSHFISGKQSRLKNIVALTYSLKLNRVYILDREEGAVLSYSNDLFGNIAPKRKLYSPFITEADDIILSKDGESLFILNKLEQEVRVFLARADVDNRAPAHDIKSIKSIALLGIDINSSRLKSIDGALYVFDSSGSLIKLN